MEGEGSLKWTKVTQPAFPHSKSLSFGKKGTQFPWYQPQEPQSRWGRRDYLDQGPPVACLTAGISRHGEHVRVIYPHLGQGLGLGQLGGLTGHAGRAQKPAQAEVQEETDT